MTTRFTVRLPDELNTLLEESAARTGVSKNVVVILALRSFLLAKNEKGMKEAEWQVLKKVERRG